MKIEGRRVFITGASSGLGEALAWAVARRGGVCALASRRIELLRSLSRRIEDEFPRVPPPMPVICDVTDRSSIRDAMRLAAGQLGGIDLLINNAGISVYGDAERTRLSDVEELVRVNFLGSVQTMHEVLPHLDRQGGGAIVNIASLAAIHGVPYLSAYGASKAAIAAYSQSLRAELRARGIRVQVVYPGYTQTPLFRSEKKVGGARRPRPPYTPAREVADSILTAIEKEQEETLLTAKGKLMSALHGVLPRLVDVVMLRMAEDLKEREVIPDA